MLCNLPDVEEVKIKRCQTKYCCKEVETGNTFVYDNTVLKGKSG